jgi:MFS family permease
VNRRDSLVLLTVLSGGVFLAGLELMITAVALPSIIVHFGDITRLREAAWIINGYLLVYVVTMPLAGRLADVWGARRLFLAGLAAFTIGSGLAGAAQSLDQLIGARLIQALGGGILVPVGTAAASHLFEGHGRARALGVIGALTFLGMAAGPLVGATILQAVHAQVPLTDAGVTAGPLVAFLTPAWRWVFYTNVPIGLAALVLAWTASAGWETPRRPGRVDVAGALLFSLALLCGLVAITLVGSATVPGGPDPILVSGGLAVASIVAGTLAVRGAGGARIREPFIDVGLFRDRVFASAALVSLLTGYAFATAIVGGAVFVDRVLYGGPASQQVALGALAGATAVGALLSGFGQRFVSLRVLSLGGLAAATVALAAMASWTPSTPLAFVAAVLALFGLGFGLTVTPRSTAAVEAAGRRAFGAASAVVTVARMLGMAVGLAVLAAVGSTAIDHLQARIYATPESYKEFIPPSLRDRELRDGLVVNALEAWAAGEATRIIAPLFLVAGLVTIVAVPAAAALGTRPRMLAGDALTTRTAIPADELTDGGGDARDDEPTPIAL